MIIEFTDSEITDLLVFLEMTKKQVQIMNLLPDDEHLRLAMINRIESLLKKFEN